LVPVACASAAVRVAVASLGWNPLAGGLPAHVAGVSDPNQ
jgi:hypothetical protein